MHKYHASDVCFTPVDGKFVLPPLPYKYDALEPNIDEETMFFHHDKHFADYTNKLNAYVKGTKMENLSIIDLMA